MEDILRKTWKEVGLGLLNLVAVVAVIAVFQPVVRKYMFTAGAGALAVLCLAAYVLGCRLIERRIPTELDARRALPEAAAGLALGFVLFAVVMGILLIAGVYHPAGPGATTGLLTGLFFAVLAGIMEEILFRGLLFRLSSKIVGTWGALIFTSALFGLAHMFNPGASFRSSLAIALEAGILLGAAYAATQRLWLPIGLHAGWNFTEGSIFGMTLSGNTMSMGLLRGSLSGPPALTGGAFGPEASIVAVLVCLAAALYFLSRIVRLQRYEPPIWSTPSQHHSSPKSVDLV
jgi:membrane protease YdiL (CAAX protease family)